VRVPVVMWPSIGIEFEVAAGKGCNASGGVGLYRHLFQFNSHSRGNGIAS